MLNSIAHRIKYNHMRKNDDQKRPLVTIRQIGKPTAMAIVGI